MPKCKYTVTQALVAGDVRSFRTKKEHSTREVIDGLKTRLPSLSKLILATFLLPWARYGVGKNIVHYACVCTLYIAECTFAGMREHSKSFMVKLVDAFRLGSICVQTQPVVFVADRIVLCAIELCTVYCVHIVLYFTSILMTRRAFQQLGQQMCFDEGRIPEVRPVVRDFS